MNTQRNSTQPEGTASVWKVRQGLPVPQGGVPQVQPGEVTLLLHPTGQLSCADASPACLRAAMAWLPRLTEQHFTTARLTGCALLNGETRHPLRWPGQHRRHASAELLAIPGAAQPQLFRLRWPARPELKAAAPDGAASDTGVEQAQATPDHVLPAAASVPLRLLELLTRPLPEALEGLIDDWAAQDVAVRVQLSDGVTLHQVSHASLQDRTLTDLQRRALIWDDSGQAIGALWWPQQSTPPHGVAASLQVLSLMAQQHRSRVAQEGLNRTIRLGAQLDRALLAVTTRDAGPDVPLHAAMRLVGATSAALVTLQLPQPQRQDAASKATAVPSLTLRTVAEFGSMPQGLTRLIRGHLIQQLSRVHPLRPFVLPLPGPLRHQLTLVVPLTPAGPLVGAWIFQCAHRPVHSDPTLWTSLLDAARQPTHLQALLGEAPDPDDHLNAMSLIRSLGETDIPYTLAERGLSHLTGRSGAESGAYLMVRASAAELPANPSSLVQVVQVGGAQADGQADTPAFSLPYSMLRSVARGGEPLLLSAPHPLLPGTLTSALLTPVQTGGRTTGVLALLDTRAGAAPDPEAAGLLALLAQRVGSAAERQQALSKLSHTREQAFRVLGTVLKYRSYETKGHTDRVTALALKLGLALDLDYGQLTHLRWGAYLHDLGKIAIPDSVLLKRGPLTPPERELMHQHVTIGEFMLREQDFVPPEVLEVVRHHHERWDGRGYPDGMSGEDIPLLARLFAIVDVYDALTSERSYKRSWSRQEALLEMRRMAGTHLDPGLLRHFERLLESSSEEATAATPLTPPQDYPA